LPDACPECFSMFLQVLLPMEPLLLLLLVVVVPL
jgi:hypothetical protein